MTIPTHAVHLLYRFAAGGLGNVIVQLIHGLPRARYRRTIVALTETDCFVLHSLAEGTFCAR
jgi:hypothetical protein